MEIISHRVSCRQILIRPWPQPSNWSTTLPQEQRIELVEGNTGIPSQYQREHTNSCLDMVRPKETEGMVLSQALAQESEEMARILAWSHSEQVDNK